MKIILDAGLQTEIELPIDNAFEHLSSNTLNVSKTVNLATEEIPDLSDMQGKTTVTTVTIKDSLNETIPLVGTYTKIEDFTISISDFNYTYSIAFAEG